MIIQVSHQKGTKKSQKAAAGGLFMTKHPNNPPNHQNQVMINPPSRLSYKRNLVSFWR